MYRDPLKGCENKRRKKFKYYVLIGKENKYTHRYI